MSVASTAVRLRAAASLTGLSVLAVATGAVGPDAAAQAATPPPRVLPAVDLGAPPDLPRTSAVDLNSRGEIIGVGQVSGTSAAAGLRWRGGRLERLPAGANVVRSINQAGQITGIEGPVSSTRGFVIPPGGTLVELPFLPSDQNETGLVVGTRYPMSNLEDVAMAWSGGQLRELTPPAGYTASFATAVNERGQIAGTLRRANGVLRAAVWAKGQWTVLALPPRAGAASAYDINDCGDVVGSVDVGLRPNPTVWTGGRATVVSSLEGQATAINNRGDVIGSIVRSGYSHGFHWRAGQLTEINPGGGRWSEAVAVNDNGLVIGNTYDSRRYRGFRWINGQVDFLGTLGGADSRSNAVDNRGQVVGAASRADGQQHAARWEP